MKRVFLIICTLLTLVSYGTTTKVKRVIDGDTFETEEGERVRLIGINAPEAHDIFGKESTLHLIELIEGRIVDLKLDHKSNNKDVYNRLLRYVILNGVDINKKMILDGYAFAYLKFAFDKEYDYKEAQLLATNNKVGIWSGTEKGVKESKKSKFIYSGSLRFYLVVGLLFVLLFIGIYYYFIK